MTPYYEQDGITVYHGDCREVLATIDPADVAMVLTDPPYGVGFEIRPTKAGHGRRNIRMGGHGPIVGDTAPFDPTPLLAFGRCVLFGAHHYSAFLPSSGGWIVWDKTGGGRGPSNSFADVDLAWTNLSDQPVLFSHLWKGFLRDSEVMQANDSVLHPSQKPVALMRWILDRWTAPGDLILDPYMGSGPVAKACHETGRRYIGIEIEERYCEIAVQRLAQGVLEFS